MFLNLKRAHIARQSDVKCSNLSVNDPPWFVHLKINKKKLWYC